eukprot:TRINITY_DN5680_c0_g1_i1.p1 TRINITY_DN5680_c0_g1~~TRINITY_DN5680_c0_g1_i1.p1  ORF type:complete len:198 (-),score=45.42 TRINITY_DN5680_c0_g1_i1:144-737(-)
MVPLIVYSLYTLLAGFALFRTVVRVPWPQKWVWLVGTFILFIDALANLLYQFGGKFVILLPLLYPIKAAIETTGTLGLVIGAFSAVNHNTISSHFYSLPTGCTPLTMLAAYIPTCYFQFGFIALFAVYLAIKQRAYLHWLLPFIFMILATAVTLSKFEFILEAHELAAVALAIASLLLAAVCTGETIEIGKLKIKIA